MIFILPFVFGAVGVAVGAVAGAFTAHAVGEKDRQAAKHHRQVANELTEKYADLEKRYHKFADESKKQINDLTRQHALSEIEKDCLRLAVRLQQSLIYLMWEIDREPTVDVLKQFIGAVEHTNNVLSRINEELVSVPSDYYERNFTKAVKSTRETAEFPSDRPKQEKTSPNKKPNQEKQVMKSYSQEFQDTYNRVNFTGNRLLSYLKELRAGRLKEGDSTPGLQSVEDSISKALQALVKQKYQVAVIAAMNAGKSTFLNALIGADVLATDMEACTVFRTDIRPIDAGQTPRLLEYRQRQENPHILAIGDAGEIKHKFIERTNQIRKTQKNSDQTIRFELEYPIEAISKLPSLAGFTLVDTPGPNDWDAESFDTVNLKQTALEALRTCDAILFILDYTSFQDDINLELLQDLIEQRRDFLLQNTGQIYFVLNKVDRKEESNRPISDVIESLRKSLVKFGIPEPNIYSASARQGLLSKLILQEKATDSDIQDFKIFYSARYATEDEEGNQIIPAPRKIASQALKDSGIPKIQNTVIQNISQNSGWNLLSDVLAVFNKAAQSVADTLITEIRGWELEFAELQKKIEAYKQRSDSARNKVANVKKSVESQKRILVTTFSQGINEFAEMAKNRIAVEIDKVAENQFKKSISLSSKENQNLLLAILNKVSSFFEDDSNSDRYKIKANNKEDAEKIGKIINEYCTPIIHNFWLDTQDRLVREGTKIREDLVKQIQQEIQSISDELSEFIGDALQVEIGTNAIQFPKFEFSGIDAKIQEQQKVVVKIKDEVKTKSIPCKPDKVYTVQVPYEEKVFYHEIDLRQIAQGIHKKIDEQVQRNLKLLERVIEKQVGEDFRKGEQQINDYINRFQADFDNLLIERVNREAESHEIVSTLKSQKSQASEYLNELIFIREMLDNWKPSPINR
ncbi:dynamin family protein [Cylindrospermum stagnale PCC 7417]|uniref:Dynamin family protein n=1 Tax=Cylindrospermum stagnale PCC 7417 TaxID=56107 RepID=K9X765_9NOST|nr:dynamin family protein [Cylindrospermum stagnale]AFZ27492.1 dynamin family protein [Cylindrospermum stagnale PCC 7417]